MACRGKCCVTGAVVRDRCVSEGSRSGERPSRWPGTGGIITLYALLQTRRLKTEEQVQAPLAVRSLTVCQSVCHTRQNTDTFERDAHITSNTYTITRCRPLRRGEAGPTSSSPKDSSRPTARERQCIYCATIRELRPRHSLSPCHPSAQTRTMSSRRPGGILHNSNAAFLPLGRVRILCLLQRPPICPAAAS